MKINKIKVGNEHYDIQDNTSGYATTSYVDNHHDSTKVDKSEISDMATETWVNEQGFLTNVPVLSVNGKTGSVVLTPSDLGLGSVFKVKGSKPTKNDLPTNNNEIGDVWYIIDESVGYIWLNDGTTNRWEQLGLEVDLSDYTTITQLNNSLSYYVQKVTGKDLSSNDFTDSLKNKLEGLSNYDDTDVKSDIQDLQTDKQDVITDLSIIRTGANKGATALQPIGTSSQFIKGDGSMDNNKYARIITNNEDPNDTIESANTEGLNGELGDLCKDTTNGKLYVLYKIEVI